MSYTSVQSHNNASELGHIGWNYYNKIIKKAMEQEFSWSGLLLSLSIAFFIVIFSAFMLRAFYDAISMANVSYFHKIQTYKLEKFELEYAPALNNSFQVLNYPNLV